MKLTNLAIFTGVLGILVWIISPDIFYPYNLIIGMIGSFLLGYNLTAFISKESKDE